MASDPLDDKAPSVFGRGDALRVAQATRTVEQNVFRDVGRGKFRGTVATFVFAVASSTITARSGATLGSGTANLTTFEDFGTEGESVDVVNMTDKTIADNAYLCLGLVDGEWVVMFVGSCANLS